MHQRNLPEKCRGTLLCLSASCWTACSTRCRAQPIALSPGKQAAKRAQNAFKNAAQASLSKNRSNYAQINGSGQVQNLQSSHLRLGNHCDLGFYPVKPRRSPQRQCVSGTLGPSTRPEPSILAFSRQKIDKLGSRCHCESLRTRIFVNGRQVIKQESTKEP